MIKSFLSAVGLSLNSFTIILTIVIAVVMLVVMYRYWINFYKKQDLIIFDINDALERLDKLEIKNASDNYEDIRNIFFKSDLLKPAWLGYQKNLFFMKDFNGKTVVFTTDDADNYFNYNSLTSQYNALFWQNLGGVFTGLGILGTFIGLSVGLGTINLEHITNEEIGNLVSGMSTAFTTSLCGIVFALFYNWLHKHITDKLSQAIK